jgi:hypothetical protein
MNITFLIGNGFDINIGMKTRYRDFYEYYTKLPTKGKSSLIKDLKNSLQEDLDKWSDFEIQFGQYCCNFTTIDDFDVVFENIRAELARYIENEQQRFDFDVDHRIAMYKYLATPETFLTRADKESIEEFKSLWKSVWNINVISYNYSTSFEKLLGEVNEHNSIGVTGINKQLLFKNVKHIHGYFTKDMVLGVNDSLQIDNELLRESEDAMAAIVKPECNKALKHLIDKDCQKIINESNLICLFGLSIGDTDKVWWSLIGERLKQNNVRLIIFYKGEKVISELDGYKIRREDAVVKDLFLSKTNLNEAEKQIVDERVLIGCDTDIFSIKLSEIKT